MKKNLTRIWLLLPLLLLGGIFTACSSDDGETSSGGEEDGTMRRTVLVYLISENDLNNVVDYDIEEILYASRAGSIPQDCNVIVYNDGVDMPSITLYNKKKSKVLKTWKQDQNSADSTVMLQVLHEMVEYAPAEHYSLVLWSHGDGWMPTLETQKQQYARLQKELLEEMQEQRTNRRAFGIDNGLNDDSEDGDYDMNISSVKWVLEKLDIHLDYLLWDACFMQTIEVAYELRKQTDWVIGSPAEASAYGAPYTTAAKALCNADIEGVMKTYKDFYSRLTDVPTFPFSAVKTSELQALADATAPLIVKYFSDTMPEGEKDAQVYSDRNIITEPEDDGSCYITGPIRYDMGSLMHKVLTPEEYTQWRPLLDKAVPYKLTPSEHWGLSNDPITYYNTLQDPDHYSGISMNVPQQQYDFYLFNDTNRYCYLGWNTYFKNSFSWWTAGGWADTGLDETDIFAVKYLANYFMERYKL